MTNENKQIVTFKRFISRTVVILILSIHSWYVFAQDSLLFSFGIFADCQYCNCDEKWGRFYRLSTGKLREAVTSFNSEELSFVVNLGDFIDQGRVSYDSLLPIIKQLKFKHYFVPGNHDYLDYEYQTNEIFKKMNLTKRYYTFLEKKLRFIAIDGNEVSVYGNNKGTEKYNKAREKLDKMEAENAKNAKMWNGTLSDEQFQWLKTELDKSKNENEKVIILCHFPVYPFNERDNLLDDKKVVNLLEGYPNVLAYFSGHDHRGRFVRNNNIYYLTFTGMVNSEENSYAIVKIFSKQIEIIGFGKEPSRILKISN